MKFRRNGRYWFFGLYLDLPYFIGALAGFLIVVASIVGRILVALSIIDPITMVNVLHIVTVVVFVFAIVGLSFSFRGGNRDR